MPAWRAYTLLALADWLAVDALLAEVARPANKRAFRSPAMLTFLGPFAPLCPGRFITARAATPFIRSFLCPLDYFAPQSHS